MSLFITDAFCVNPPQYNNPPVIVSVKMPFWLEKVKKRPFFGRKISEMAIFGRKNQFFFANHLWPQNVLKWPFGTSPYICKKSLRSWLTKNTIKMWTERFLKNPEIISRLKIPVSPSKMNHTIRKWSFLTANEGKSDQKSRTYSDEKVSRHFNSDDYNSILGE